MPAHQIVIIGASFAGIPAAHTLLKTILPNIPHSEKHTYKVALISPSSDFYWKVGSPRTIANPNALPISKVLLPIAPGFAQYPPDRFTFIQAYATSIDSSTRTIHLSTSSSVNYDSLVLASGTSFISPIWSVADGSDATTAALRDIHARLPAAETVLVAGGGAAGVETAGELGALYGKTKKITILSGSSNLLGKLKNQGVGKAATKRLEGMGVRVVNGGLKVESSRREGDRHVLQLSDGSSMTVDVFIEATGDRPNSKFVPKEWLNDKSYVKTDPQTLRLNVPGVTDVYCIGSVASYSDGSILDTMYAQAALLESIRLDLVAKAGSPDQKKRKILYKKFTQDMQIVPVGPSGGVGVVMGWQVPSFFVWAMKSRDFMIGKAQKAVDGIA